MGSWQERFNSVHLKHLTIGVLLWEAHPLFLAGLQPLERFMGAIGSSDKECKKIDGAWHDILGGPL